MAAFGAKGVQLPKCVQLTKQPPSEKGSPLCRKLGVAGHGFACSGALKQTLSSLFSGIVFPQTGKVLRKMYVGPFGRDIRKSSMCAYLKEEPQMAATGLDICWTFDVNARRWAYLLRTRPPENNPRNRAATSASAPHVLLGPSLRSLWRDQRRLVLHQRAPSRRFGKDI